MAQRQANPMMPDWYDRDGLPVSQVRLGMLLADRSYVRIARTVIMDAADANMVRNVSTAWIGRDQRCDDDGPPLIFETLVTSDADEGTYDELYCEHYATERQAREGHRQNVVYVSMDMVDPIVMDTTD